MRLVLSTIALFSIFFSLAQEKKDHFKTSFTIGYANYYEGNSDMRASASSMYTKSEYSRVDSANFGNGLTFGILLSHKRWTFPISLGATLWRHNITAEQHVLTDGNILFRRFVDYAESAFYGDLSIGASYHLIQKPKFTLAPVIRLNPEIRLGEIQTDSVTLIIEEDYHYHQNSRENVIFDDKLYTGFNGFLRSLQPSLGLNLGVNFNKRTSLYLELGYAWQHFSRLSFGPLHKNQSGTYCRLSLGFLLDSRKK